jgi:hypothetical protein
MKCGATPGGRNTCGDTGGWGSGVAQWLRPCATSRTDWGSIPGGVTGFFSDISPSDRSTALGSTQPQVKMSTRNMPGGKGGRCVRPITSPPSRAECHEIWEPKPPGILWATLASCKMGTGSCPGVRCGRGLTLTPHPLLVPRSKTE